MAHGDRPLDRIRDLDAVVDGDGQLHVVWQTVSDRPDGDKLWYSHVGGDRSQWSEPRLVDSTWAFVWKLAVTDSQLHLVLSGHGLRHLVAMKGTGTWQDRGVIARPSDRVQSFDAIGNGSQLIVVYLAYCSPDSEARFEDMTTKLVAVEVDEGRPIAYHDLAAFPHLDGFRTGGPRLARWRGEIHVVCATSGMDTVKAPSPKGLNEAWQSKAGAPWMAPRSRLFELHREPTGGAWSSPKDLLPQELGTSIQALAVATTFDRMFVFFERNRIEASESADGRRWSAPVRLGKPEPWRTSDTGRNLAASADSEAVVVAWIDKRFDWYERLPNLGNNPSFHADVLAIQSTGHPATLANLLSSPILRVTPTSGYVGGVVARSCRGRNEVVWTDGYPRLDGSPEIKVARLPTTAGR